jgi:hypothetical protein
MNFTKQQLKDEAFLHYHQLTQNWQPSSGESLSEYLNRIDKGKNYIDDFVQFLIERNFKK